MPRLKSLLQSKFFLIVSLIFLVLYVLTFTKLVKYKSKYIGSENTIEGIIEVKKVDGDKLSLEVKGKEKLTVSYYFKNIQDKEELNKLKLGEKVQLQGVLTKPSNNTIPNTFNYRKYLYNKKIYWQFNASRIKIIEEEEAFLYKIKNYFNNKVDKYSLTNGYMKAFILGDKNYIDADTYETFQNNGVTHLFAVSGMHVSFLVLALSSVLTKLKLKETKVNIIIISFLFFYMFLIGFTASVVRASLLYIGLLINKKSNLNLSSINVLYLIFLLLLIINPFYINDLGFIYSFLTAFGLMLFTKKITGNYITKLLKVSLIAFLFSLPVTLYNFYEFNLLTVFNNIIIVPMVSVVLFPFTIICFFVPFLEATLNIGFTILSLVSTTLDNLGIYIVVPKINSFFILIYYFIIYLIYKKGWRYLFGIFTLIIIFKWLPIFDSNAYVYFLDVGQGDSSLIVTENRQDVVMIDTGGKIEFAKEEWQERQHTFKLSDNIITFLKSLGINKIDLLICTHGDMDHLGYAKDLMEAIKVGEIMLNNNSYNYKEKELLSLNSSLIKDNYKGHNIQIKNLNKSIYTDENDSSLVLLANLQKSSFLFMGDAPKKVEKEIQKYPLKVDYLKLGHHGSNTSSDYNFLKTVNPIYSIISAGKNNRYNHPSPETIANLNDLNLEYLSTIDKGTIEFKLTKKGTKINFYAP